MSETRPADERTVELLIEGGLSCNVIARAIINGTIDFYLQRMHFSPEQIARDVFNLKLREQVTA